MSTLNDKNIAVLGGGYWGRNLIRVFSELHQLHTVCDIDQLTLDGLTKLYPSVLFTEDYSQILLNPDIDAVVIATPASTHYSFTAQALNAGKDVFVEKPLALHKSEGEGLVELARKRSRILMVGHLLVYHPAIIELRRLITSEKLGRIKYVYSNRLNLGKIRTEENVLWSFAPHDISAILYLIGEIPVQVSAEGGYYVNKDVADTALIKMSFPENTKSHIFVSWLHPFKEQRLVVIGDQQMAVFNDVEKQNKLTLYEYSVDSTGKAPVTHKSTAIQISIPNSEPLKMECQHFIDCINTRDDPRTSGEKALRVLQILEACQMSMDRGPQSG
jgi:UDP-2-acetamido-3-amino-2,3-dideoxy-glucuronate N-acetyltransferase